MRVFKDDTYEMVIIGRAEAVKIDDLRDWHALRATCVRCGHAGYINACVFRRLYPRYIRLIDTEHRFRCTSCNVRGAVSWMIVKLRR
ncbi:hypothetical protein [Ascidiaceihabitans sp.]|uniref:hypothetical protein n=1 Tax=Ascidiaceihabitans sp. TaxID=1872644 RepID=UPI003298D16F